MSIITNNWLLALGIVFTALCALAIFGYRFLLRHNVVNLLKKKNETGERFASQTKPIIGGTIFFVCVIIGFFIALPFVTTITYSENIALLLCCIIAFGMGCIDDLKNFSPLFKLIFQIICAIIIITCDNHIETSDNIFLNYTITIFWVVFIMNSINMLDNMDGVTASISIIIFIALFGLAIQSSFDAIIILSIIASLAAFLFWNWYPSKMYMGDNGSQLLGVLLAYFSIKYIWNSNDSVIGFNYEQIVFIALMFIIPITDTVTVAINRFLGNKSPFVGDRYHTTHCLVYQGLSVPQTATLLCVINTIGCALSWYFITFQYGKITMTEVFWGGIFELCVFIVFYTINLIIRKKNNLLYKRD